MEFEEGGFAEELDMQEWSSVWQQMLKESVFEEAGFTAELALKLFFKINFVTDCAWRN